MKIDIGPDGDPYKALSDFLYKWFCENVKKLNLECFQTLIVFIRTGTLGDDQVLAFVNHNVDGFEFDTDWYEGGDLEITGITPFYDIKPTYTFE